MPRVIDRANNPFDFCVDCFPDESFAQKRYGSRFRGNGPDGRGNCYVYDADHPPYDELDYECEVCGKLLDGDDDFAKEL